MSDKQALDSKVYGLMGEVRRFTRASLMLQHIIADQMGLQATEAECIDFLQEMGPATAGALSKATRLTTGAITNVIDRLEKAGFVKRSADPKDRRKVIVTFVADNHGKAKQFYTALANDVEQLCRTYTEQELEFLIGHTNALREIYQQNALKVDQQSQ